MKQENLKKYSKPVPRYTSYPPANFFNEMFTAESYRKALIRSNDQQPEHISIYIHIPFCYQMCYYCGCNALQMRGKDQAASYIEALKTEMRMVLPLLNKDRKISQIHYGGGTPTSQPVAVLKELNEIILSEFDCIENPEIAIECHPGFMDQAYWDQLPEAGFNRISIGVQDFDEDVLEACNRKASRISIDDIVERLRGQRVAINMDFIYGLPLQTVDSFTKTIQQAIAIRPHRLVTFSYAHVPWVSPLQKKLEEVGLPSVEEKSRLFEAAKALLNDAGYMSVGLDHFVLPDDELYIAASTHTLHRNFQGYCTRRTTGQVYAFGVTGISQLGTAYSQNVKEVDEYILLINRGELPVLRGYELSEEEQITRNVISNLMCNYTIRWNDIACEMNQSADEIKAAMNYDESVLQDFAADGIISYNADHITILPDATPFVRNVAGALDKLMIDSDKQYSKSI